MIDLILLLQADHDIQQAFERYEDYQAGRGELLLRQLDGALGSCSVVIPKSLLFTPATTDGCCCGTFHTEFSIRSSHRGLLWRRLWICGRTCAQFAEGSSAKRAVNNPAQGVILDTAF